MNYGYARVSTNGQDVTGQINELKKAGCEIIYHEKFTGTKSDRKEFQKVLEVLAPRDILTVTKLDRFARSTTDALRIIKELFERGVKIHVLNIGVMEDTPTGRLIFTIFSAFAEFERDLITTRTQEGKAIARLKEGYKEGRPKKFTRKQVGHALGLLDTHSYKQVEEMTGISKSTLIRAKKSHQTITSKETESDNTREGL